MIVTITVIIDVGLGRNNDDDGNNDDKHGDDDDDVLFGDNIDLQRTER